MSLQIRGERTIVQALDHMADAHPNKIQVSVLRDADVSKGFFDYTHAQTRAAADSFAHWLVATYGPSKTIETIAYVGLQDLRYVAVLFGCVKAGYKALFVSPRNPPDQNASLLEQTGARRFLHAREQSPVVAGVKTLLPDLDTREVKPFDELIRDSAPFAFDKPYALAKDDPILVLHSSGSTGRPKPVTITNAYFAASDRELRPVNGQVPRSGASAFDGGAFLSPFPLFHLAGLQAVSVVPVFAADASVVTLLADRPPSPALVLEVLRAKRPHILYGPPSLVEGVAALRDGLDALATCARIGYAGGPLAQATGDSLVACGVELGTLYGSTETGGTPLLPPPPADWAYLRFHPDFCARLEPTGDADGLCELVFHRDDPGSELRGITFTHPEAAVYRTRDLFAPHATEPDLWRFAGRSDDVIVFATGEKYNPTAAEGLILGAQGVAGVLVAGDGRAEACALLEPDVAVADVAAFVNGLWPVIEAANTQSQRQGRLARRMVAVVEPGGLVRAPKGSVVRSLTREKYADVIDRLYADADEGRLARGPGYRTSSDGGDDMKRFVRECVRSLSGVEHLTDDDDLYVHGVDSVQTAELSRLLRSGLRSEYADVSWMTTHLVFGSPTISRLARTIRQQLGEVDSSSEGAAGDVSPEAQMDALFEKYTARVPPFNNTPTSYLMLDEKQGLSIALTGSTGSLGQHLLRTLLSTPSVTAITSLDRDPKAKSRISAANLDLDLSRVTFHHASLDRADFGLDAPALEALSTVDAVLHCAWAVDFNHTLSSFEAVHIASVANLLDLAARAQRPPRIAFVSSVAAVARWGRSPGNAGVAVPERICADSAVAAPSGYGRSKSVAERLLAAAASRSGSRVSVTVLRVGQIAGPSAASTASSAHWKRGEWVPSLLATSAALGVIPDDLPEVDWLPVDIAATALVELLLHDLHSRTAKGRVSVYNVVNPRSVPWSDFLSTAAAEMGVSAVPLAEWIARVDARDAEDVDDLRRYPALKLLGFFQGVEAGRKENGQVRWETGRARGASGVLAGAQGVSAAWMRAWIRAMGLGVGGQAAEG